MSHKYRLEPRDLLFLRDARPMGGSDAGLGAGLPRPDQLWNAIINAFHRAWPDRQIWEGAAHTKRGNGNSNVNGKRDNSYSSDRFGALKTIGTFPIDTKNSVIYYPAPLDLDMELVPCDGTDLPQPLTHAFRARTLGKKESRPWLSNDEYQSYLKGESVSSVSDEETELYDVERNLGIEIDAITGTVVKSKLYQAEYLRLRDGFRRDGARIALAFTVSCDIRPKGAPSGFTVDVFEKFKEKDSNIIIGGQQGVARLRPAAFDWIKQQEITSPYLRWTLLTPAVFRAGWIPGWCSDYTKPTSPGADEKPPGTVMFPNCPPSRLIAARIGKPLAFSGWDLQTGPKPTQLAVPAGSCYVFDCGTDENARKLAELLYFKPCSDQLGEKGFGIGVCSSVEF